MTGKHLDLEITRDVRQEDVHWPDQGELRGENVGMNHSYWPLPLCTWQDVRTYIGEERQLLSDYERPDPDIEDDEEADDEEYFDDSLLGLDLGTNALAAALRASKCFPFYSCNGGVFGAHHNDWHPVIAFYCRPPILPFLVRSAEAAKCGLQFNHAGGLTVYAAQIDHFLDMAEQLYEMRACIRATPVKAPSRPKPRSRQLNLI